MRRTEVVSPDFARLGLLCKRLLVRLAPAPRDLLPALVLAEVGRVARGGGVVLRVRLARGVPVDGLLRLVVVVREARGAGGRLRLRGGGAPGRRRVLWLLLLLLGVRTGLLVLVDLGFRAGDDGAEGALSAWVVVISVSASADRMGDSLSAIWFNVSLISVKSGPAPAPCGDCAGSSCSCCCCCCA